MRDAINLPFKTFVKSAPVNKPKRHVFQLLKLTVFTFGFLSLPIHVQADDLKFDLPIKCNLERDCFIQNLPDIIEGKGASDTYCQGATYDGHKGIDIRLFSLENIKENIPVIASADGIVKAFRDGEDDKIIATAEDKKLVANKECGNGIVITHRDGYESQYCHMKKNSISVQKGQSVKRGDTLGFVGNSGLAQFPHIHLSIRQDGQWLDPISGQKPSDTCALVNSNSSKSLLTQSALQFFQEDSSRLIASGISGNVIKHNELVKKGAPAKLALTDQAIVGWAWFINLRKGDKIRFKLEGPEGLISENTIEPLDRHKATYSGFSGRKRKPIPGEYRLRTELLRDGKRVQDALYVQSLE